MLVFKNANIRIKNFHSNQFYNGNRCEVVINFIKDLGEEKEVDFRNYIRSFANVEVINGEVFYLGVTEVSDKRRHNTLVKLVERDFTEILGFQWNDEELNLKEKILKMHSEKEDENLRA